MDEVLTTVASEPVTPAGGEQTTNVSTTENTEVENQDFDLDSLFGGGDGDEGNGDEPEPVEIDINGKKYKVHPDLKDRVWFDTDYTQKSQANAELKKSLEARQVEIDQAYNTSQDVMQGRAALINLDGALAQYEGVDWDKLGDDDPVAAQTHWRKFQQLQQERGRVAQYLDDTQRDLSEKHSQAAEARIRETKAFAEKELRGWTPEMDRKITEFATKDLGFTPEEFRNAITPKVYRAFYLAHIGEQVLAKLSKQPKPATAEAQPLSTVKARGNPTTGLDDRLSQEEWLKRRNAQVRGG